MLFFPYKADADIPGVPVVTVAIALLCAGVFYAQLQSEEAYRRTLVQTCERVDNRVVQMALRELSGDGDSLAGCVEFLRRTDRHSAAHEPVDTLVAEVTQRQSKRITGTAEYLRAELGSLQRRFQTAAPAGLLTDRLAYPPDSWDPLRMLTATIAHGGWLHLLGNLIFFWAFAVTAEAILGTWRFALFCLAMAIGTHAVYSVASLSSRDALPTVGLSGVVYSVMALTAFFLPGAPIRTALWVIFRFYTLLIPAWFFVLWYAGFDAYQLFSGGESGGVNLVAHVSGAVLAVVCGVVVFGARRRQLHQANVPRAASARRVAAGRRG